MKKIEFSLNLVKKISEGKIKGKIKNLMGNPVKILETNINDKDGKTVLGLVTKKDGIQEPITYYSNGKFFNCNEKSLYDLVLEIEEGVLIVNPGDFIKFNLLNSKITFIGIVDRVDVYNEESSLFLKCSSFFDNEKIRGFKLNENFRPICKISEIDLNEVKYLTEDEKNLLISELNKYNRDWDNTNKIIIDNNVFEIGTKVLGLDGSGNWRFDFFSHFDSKGNYVCTGRTYREVVVLTEESKKLVRCTQQ